LLYFTGKELPDADSPLFLKWKKDRDDEMKPKK
jgi:hypothetical protein